VSSKANKLADEKRCEVAVGAGTAKGI